MTNIPSYFIKDTSIVGQAIRILPVTLCLAVGSVQSFKLLNIITLDTYPAHDLYSWKINYIYTPLIAPWWEGFILLLMVRFLKYIKMTDPMIILSCAIIWGGLHAYSSHNWLFVPAFLIFYIWTALYMELYKKSENRAFITVATAHVFHNILSIPISSAILNI